VGFNVFITYFVVYSFSLFLVFSYMSHFSKPLILSARFKRLDYFSLVFVSLRGLPPFPLFFVKILVLFCLFTNFDVSHLFILFITRASLMLIGYVQSVSKFVMHSAACQTFLRIK
jgi:hypothetical protein